MQRILDSMTFLRTNALLPRPTVPALLSPLCLLCCQSFDLLCLGSLAISALICRVIPDAQPEPQPQSRCLEISVNYFAITRLTAHTTEGRGQQQQQQLQVPATAISMATATGNSNIAGIGLDTELLIAVAEAALTEGISIALCCQFECNTTRGKGGAGQCGGV